MAIESSHGMETDWREEKGKPDVATLCELQMQLHLKLHLPDCFLR
jgi:hypothetical protein